MKKFLSHIYIMLATFCLMACSDEEANAMPPANECTASGKTLVVYYSFTNNCKEISETMTSQVSADVVRIEPTEKGLDYAANGYALGTQLLNTIQANPNSESSYPAIDPVSITMSDYTNVIIVTPLWWSQMAAPMQTFLFKYKEQMAGKNVGLIVSSHSSGISGVESDCRRLVPASTCNYLSKSLWINASNHSRRATLIEQWLKDVNFSSLTTNTQTSTMNIIIGGKPATCKLADNAATQALLERLAGDDVTYNAHEYGGFEMVGDIGFSLPTSDTQITTQVGDVMLYTGDNICIFAGQNSWAYTPIGRIEGMSTSELRSFLNMDNGNATITLSLRATGIDNVNAASAKSRDVFYSINGQRITQVPVKGIYIENGVKKAK